MIKRICDVCLKEVPKFETAGMAYIRTSEVDDVCSSCHEALTSTLAQVRADANDYEETLRTKRIAALMKAKRG